MTSRIYCTYFDHRYAPRGVAMIRSLCRHSPDAEVFVLCLNEIAATLLQELREPGVAIVCLSELEAADSELAAARSDGRSILEFFYTCTPSLIRHVFAKSQADFVTYLDSDLWFFSDPRAIYDEMASASVLIIPHRHPPWRRNRYIQYGAFNVGWLTFHRDAEALACLDWWRSRCLEWCRAEVDEANDRYADQRYLDRFSRLFPGVHVLAHPGANLAPWNIDNHVLTFGEGVPLVDGQPLVFFHFHALKRIARSLFKTPFADYGIPLTRQMRAGIFLPYLFALLEAEGEIAPILERLGHGIETTQPRKGLARLREFVEKLAAIIRGAAIYLPAR
jgi:hypothetical protein